MKSFTFRAIALAVVGMCGVGTFGQKSIEDSLVRSEIQTQYNQMMAALAKNDVKSALPLVAKNFGGKDIRGQYLGLTDLFERWNDLRPGTDFVPVIRNYSCKVSKNQASIKGHFQWVPKVYKPKEKMATESLPRFQFEDNWVKSGSKWLLKSIREVKPLEPGNRPS